jgi:hypothetical protein
VPHRALLFVRQLLTHHTASTTTWSAACRENVRTGRTRLFNRLLFIANRNCRVRGGSLKVTVEVIQPIKLPNIDSLPNHWFGWANAV